MIALYVEDTLVDLPEGAVFAKTVQKLDFGDLATRKVDFTNSVKLPWTQTNEVLFGFAKNEKSVTDRPYVKMSLRLVENGVETISDGLCWITAVDKTGVTIAIYENALNIFDIIGGKKLNRLSHIADSAWAASDIDAARTATSGLISAVIDWGRNGGASIYNSAYFLPSFFYHSFITEILEQTNLTLSGAILTDQSFLDLVVPYGLSKYEYPASVNTDYSFRIGKDSISKNITIAADAGSPSTDVVELDYDLQNPPSTYQGGARIWDTSTFKATIPDTGSNNAWLVATISGAYYINITAWNPGDEFIFTIRVRDKNGFVIASQTTGIDYTTFGAAPIIGLNQPLQALTTSLSDGDQVDMTVGTLVGSGSGAITMAIRRGTVAPYNNIKLETPSGGVGSPVKWQLLLPDVLQSSLLRDFFVRFAIIPKQTGGTLYLKTIKEITEDRANAVDWTNKRVKGPDVINYAPRNYAQSNTFTYSADSGAGIEPDENAGSSAIYVGNTSLPTEKNAFGAFFEVGNDDTVFSVLAALVRVYDSGSAGISDFSNNEPGLRLLTLRAKEAGEPNITFNAIARSDYKVANFLYPTGTKDTSWNYFLLRYYGPVFLDAMENIRVVTQYYTLNELDIANYDPHKMIHDNGSYYLIEKIENYIPGRVTKVTMLKI